MFVLAVCQHSEQFVLAAGVQVFPFKLVGLNLLPALQHNASNNDCSSGDEERYKWTRVVQTSNDGGLGKRT